MWNAYKTEGKSLPNKDIRVNNLQVDGELEFSNYKSFTATVTAEDTNVTNSVTFEILEVGDVYFMKIPTIDQTLGASVVNAYKAFTLPAEFRPVTDQYFAINCRTGPSPGYPFSVGTAFIAASGSCQLYTAADRSAPVASNSSKIFSCMICWSKEL